MQARLVLTAVGVFLVSVCCFFGCALSLGLDSSLNYPAWTNIGAPPPFIWCNYPPALVFHQDIRCGGERLRRCCISRTGALGHAGWELQGQDGGDGNGIRGQKILLDMPNTRNRAVARIISGEMHTNI